jgi:hypothetical protein
MENLQLRDVEPPRSATSPIDTAVDPQSVPERLTLRLSPEARKTLAAIADQRGVSFGEVIRRALGTEKYLIDVINNNGRILVEQPGERMKELVII